MSGIIKSLDHALGSHKSNDVASTNPAASTTAEGPTVGGLLKADAERGAAVHAFDPDATPEEKAAAAGKARAQLQAIPGTEHLKHRRSALGGRAVAIDTSTTNGAPAPTITMADIDHASRAEGQEVGGQSVPGAIPTGAAPPVPKWLQVGWKEVAGAALSGSDEHQRDLGILAHYVSDQAYGAWYHNAAIILFAVLTTRFITVIHLGWGWVICILASCAAYYTLSMQRTRARARDDIQRELVKTRLVTETESADWLNGFLDRFWLIYEPVLSQTIVASVDAVLAASTPSFLESIRLTTFTLGTKAPRIDFVRTFPKTPEDTVIMDWALSFTPNDLMDITPRQAAKRVNPKVVLSIRVGKGAVSKNLPILLEDMSFTGRMRVKLKLMTNFPHVQTVELSFIQKPTFDYVLKPLGGETFGFDINNIPGLAPFIRDQVHANLGPMMYDPNVFTIDLQALLSGTPLDAAIGVLKVTVTDARGIKAVKFGGGAPDPYVSIGLGAKPPIAKTQTIPSSHNPSWNETKFILITTLADVLNLGLWDYNEHRPDNHLGAVTQELATLKEDAEQEGLVGKIISGGKERGELRYDLSYFPVLQPQKAADGTIEPLPDTETGIVRFTIHQAKDLDISREHGDLSPFVKVFLGSSQQPVHTTPILKNTSNPIWESHCEFLVPEKHKSIITLQVIDNKEWGSDPKLGRLSVKLTDLIEARERQQDWYPLQECRAGRIRLTTEWKPVAMAGSMEGAGTYVPPIGILRLWLKKAIDVKNVEAALGGKSDPYVRVLRNNIVLARTEVINNNLNPEWDQIVYVPVKNLRQSLILELMDYQNIGKDRSLGYTEIKVGDFVSESSDQKYPFVSKGTREMSDKIKIDRVNYKGTLIYQVDFKPAMSLRGGVSFDPQENALDAAAEAESARQRKESETAGVPAAETSGNGLRHKPSVSIASEASKQSKASESKAGGEATAAENPEVGVVMSDEELMASQSGVLVFQVISGQLARKGSLEILFDDGYWPSFTTARARSSHPTWDQIGEGFVRELDFSRIWLRINAGDDSSNEEIVAEFKCDTKSFLEKCMKKSCDFLLSQADGSNRSMITLSARYIPVDIKLEPRESINNMGVLRVEVIGAKGLAAADRSGKSDPYIIFTLNGQRVFKSETKKKTLSPVWNESFETLVPSRVAAKLHFEINDWDRVGSATPLGDGPIDLAALEPFESTNIELPVNNPRGSEKGTLSLRLLFQPEIIARTRQKTSTFSMAGRAVTQIGALPFAAGKGVVHGGGAVAMGVGHGLGTVGGFAGRHMGLIKKKDASGKEVLAAADGTVVNGTHDAGFDVPAGQTSQPVDAEGVNADGLPVGAAATTPPPRPATEPGVLNVTVMGAKDLKSDEGSGLKSFVQLRMAGKAHKTDHVKGLQPEWNESFSFNVAPGTSTLQVAVMEHHTFGKDAEVGEAEVDIWTHIQPAIPNADVWIELKNGTGLLRLRLDWNTSSAPGSATAMDKKLKGRSPSIISKRSHSRFSLSALTPTKKEHQDVS
ncbi:C2 domain-containing protein [Kockovaella imperatae]|uniref:C2 domain-containing protein n=1 Tax=Kockovaella imperatae TaxID=4999 RepID=A0A1Y1USJ1_9TREE|nr:C2 domain-containing protein [Kockovaella imperatae]ORX40969.1 C2 domain-containing protein [Kockovaella imperatae]